jgi:hypothetical protein
MIATFRKLVVLAVLAGVLPDGLAAQGYPASQRATMSQDIALTTVKVSYGRPVARGRVLWGQLVPWDSIWHPGADSATIVSFNHDVVVEGHALKAGEYSLWLVPRATKPWTVVFSRAAHTFHKPYPGESEDALRFEVAPVTLSHVETMAIEFPVVLRDEAVLQIHWGTTGVPVRLKAPYKPD